MKRCTNCGAMINDQSGFCTYCGGRQPMARFCPSCGAAYPAGSMICTNCNQTVNAGVTTYYTFEGNYSFSNAYGQISYSNAEYSALESFSRLRVKYYFASIGWIVIASVFIFIGLIGSGFAACAATLIGDVTVLLTVLFDLFLYIGGGVFYMIIGCRGCSIAGKCGATHHETIYEASRALYVKPIPVACIVITSICELLFLLSAIVSQKFFAVVLMIFMGLFLGFEIAADFIRRQYKQVYYAVLYGNYVQG